MPVGLSPATASTIKSKSAAISTSYLCLSMLSFLRKAPPQRLISPRIGGLFRPRSIGYSRLTGLFTLLPPRFNTCLVNHGGANSALPEEFLNCADVIPIPEQMGCKGMPEGVWSCWLCQPGVANGTENGFDFVACQNHRESVRFVRTNNTFDVADLSFPNTSR